MVDMTYVALRRLKVGGEIREEGDLVPEAKDWKTLRSSIAQNRVAYVPRSTVDQDALREAEERYESKLRESQIESEPEQEEDDDVEAFATGTGWYEVPGSDKKMRREEAEAFLANLEDEGEE